jgi:hypothetical protein
MTRKAPPHDQWNNENSNTSNNPHIDQVLQSRLSRRNLLLGSAGSALAGVLGATGLTTLTSPAHAAPSVTAGWMDQLGFQPVAKSLADAVVVPPGYTAEIVYALGDPLNTDTAAFKNDGTDTHFEHRAGDHHDGMAWFGFNNQGTPDAKGSVRGVIAMNHEATTDEKLTSFFIHSDGGQASLPRATAEVEKEMMIHGISVVEMHKQSGTWRYQQNSAFNRRITPLTKVDIHGPARGSAHLVTRYSPQATTARGTINNCGAGTTPWNTFVSGEENWNGYFFRDAQDDARRGKNDKSVVALLRYGRKAGEASRHGWETAGSADRYQRWNNSATAPRAELDYRNEMNTFGYIVEVDPYNPQLALRKRTALGRFAHENCTFAKPIAGKPIVAYMGDDSRNEYMYKFVSKALWDPKDAKSSNRLAAGDKYLNEGTLFVAKFHDDGRGEWLELSINNPIVAAYPDFEFTSNADVAVFTRLAADAVNATKMDRPEWGGVNPRNGEVYFTLTNNSRRTVDGEFGVDAANPRSYADMKGNTENKGNVNGHIIRLAEPRPWDTSFRWDIYLFGAQADADVGQVNLSRLTDDNDTSSVDGLVFSPNTGICWIQTDDAAYTDQTNCMMLAAIPGQVGDGSTQTLRYSRADGSEKVVSTPVGKAPGATTLKRFLVGPRGCEITGWCETPDGKTIFVNIQHPGENTKMADINNPNNYESQWPANAGYGAGKRPRSATIAITKTDGGRIGS